MQKIQLFVLAACLSTLSFVHAQKSNYKFGSGFKFENKDSTFYLRAAFRFQSLYTAGWNVRNSDLSKIEGLNTNFLIRRARLKFDGYALTPKLKYKFELGVSNRDIGAGDDVAFNNASNIILDAYFVYNFHKGFSILVGQTKLPGNRERVISSANLQMVDRSRLNSRFNLDRDMGFQLIHKGKLGPTFGLVQKLALSQGEGRDVTIGNTGGGFEYTYRIEAYPFGDFMSKGDYSGGDLKREQKPKLAIGGTFDVNNKAARTRGNLGSFILADSVQLKTLYSGFIDLMFKYKGFSLMGEYAIRGTDGKDPFAYYENGSKAATYFTGAALNLQAGYLFKKNFELSGRYTIVKTHNAAVGRDESEYTIGFSRYIVGHSLKVQTDLGYRSVVGSNDGLVWRLQFDFHL